MSVEIDKKTKASGNKLFLCVLTFHKQGQLHVDVFLPCLYMIFFVKGTCFHTFSFHIALLHLLIFLHFNTLECLPGVQYVLNLTDLVIMYHVLLFFSTLMVFVDAGSCWISFLDLCDVT